ncbi:hypothetical protein ACLOJK_034809 [Asimina triloba]
MGRTRCRVVVALLVVDGEDELSPMLPLLISPCGRDRSLMMALLLIFRMDRIDHLLLTAGGFMPNLGEKLLWPEKKKVLEIGCDRDESGISSSSPTCWTAWIV